MITYDNKGTLDCRSKIVLCESFVSSHLNFCDLIYGHYITHNNQRLQLIQNTCIRLINNKKVLRPKQKLPKQKAIVLITKILGNTCKSFDNPVYL